MLTSTLPFDHEDPAELMRLNSDAEPMLPSDSVPEIPAGRDEIVLRCLAKDPDDRYLDADELADALRPFARTSVRPPSVPPPRSRSRAPRPQRAEPVARTTLVALGVGVVLAAGGVMAMLTALSIDFPSPSPATAAVTTSLAVPVAKPVRAPVAAAPAVETVAEIRAPERAAVEPATIEPTRPARRPRRAVRRPARVRPSREAAQGRPIIDPWA